MSAVELSFEPHPLLYPAAFEALFPRPVGQLDGAPFQGLLNPQAETPLARSEERRRAVRDLLRHGGHRPTGRGKPSSEYLLRAAGEGKLASINPAVDVANAVSLASGIPISVIDLDRVEPPLRIAIPTSGSYVFNPSGQEISLAGLLSLADRHGPCANAVKDAQRSKTSPATTRTLSILWGPATEEAAIEAALAWYGELLAQLGAQVTRVA